MNLPSKQNLACPCGSGLILKRCCSPVIEKQRAKTPEQLMRSRYTAYSLGAYQYVLDTYHSSTRPTITSAQLAQDSLGTEWIKLRIMSNASDRRENRVQFKAISKQQGHLYCLHENARFVQDMGLWFYLDGDISTESGRVKLGRNALCVCDSGKKLKRCCGK